jgi:hypothetical protein
MKVTTFDSCEAPSPNDSGIFWLVVSNMNFIFHNIYGIILPIDLHIFQDGQNHQAVFQWIGLREILQETIDFPIKYGAFL